jgi:creatinine amidohydrolase
MTETACRFMFEDTGVGRMKERIFKMTDDEIEALAKEYGLPSPGELEKPGTYIQNSLRGQVIENRRKNDIVIVPVGCTENHGLHTVSGFDTFLVTRIGEAVRRRQIKKGKPPVNLAFPINYGIHPPWHQGMPGSVMISDDAFEQSIMHMMWGLGTTASQADLDQQPRPE